MTMLLYTRIQDYIPCLNSLIPTQLRFGGYNEFAVCIKMNLRVLYETTQQNLDLLMLNRCSQEPKSRLTPYRYLTLSGGGVRGLCTVGALSGLMDRGLLQMGHLEAISATSIGAFIALLLLIGYHPRELYHLAKVIDLSRLSKLSVDSMVNLMGLDDGHNFHIALSRLLMAKGLSIDLTFKELYQRTQIDFTVTVTNLTLGRGEYYSHISHPDAQVIQTVLSSTKVPIFFAPIKNQKRETLVDGACFDNYPIHLFSQSLQDTIGIFTYAPIEVCPEITNLEDYLLRLIVTMMYSNAQTLIRGFEDQTIRIESSVSLTSLPEVKLHIRKLFRVGYRQAINYSTPLL